MNVLFICTSNKDRSPALKEYFEANYTGHSYASAGINSYFTKKHGTHYLTPQDVKWANLIVCCESIHGKILRDILILTPSQLVITLGLGEFKPDSPWADDYILQAEQILKPYL